MKRLSNLLLAITLLVCPAAFGAPALGLKVGLNLANVSHDPPSPAFNYSIRPGVVAGGVFEFSVAKNNTVTIRQEVLYVMKGSQISGTVRLSNGAPVDVESTLKVDELAVAPFVVRRFPRAAVTPFLEIGPELGVNLIHKIHTEVSEYGLVQVTNDHDLADWASTNISLNLGAGFTVPSGRGEAVFDLRYNIGLSDMYTGDDDYHEQTTGLQLLMAYNFAVPAR